MRFAVAVEFALWMQSLRMLSIPLAVLILGGFVLLEYLFQQAATGERKT
jgi:hypothetical protein